MKNLLIGLFMLTSVSVSTQTKFAEYGQQTEQPKEQVYRTVGYYEDLSGEVSRVSLKFTVTKSYTGESLAVVGYNSGITWISTNAYVYKTGYGDPKDFDYKVGLANVGTVYFNF